MHLRYQTCINICIAGINIFVNFILPSSICKLLEVLINFNFVLWSVGDTLFSTKIHVFVCSLELLAKRINSSTSFVPCYRYSKYFCCQF